MKPDRVNNDLLDDVLDEAASPDFRATLLDATLKQARRRRRVCRARHAALPTAALAVTVLLAWIAVRPSDPSGVAPAEPPYRVVHTQPLPAAALVATQPLSTESTVTSAPFSAVVHTTPGSGGFRLISDEELLALVARPAVLVRVGPHKQELIFLSPSPD